jgi:hypothetical protein
MFAELKRKFRSRSERSAVRKYARLLGPQLRRDYGASEYYTPGQITAAVATCQLPLEYISFAYAAFLSEEAFRNLGVDGDYPSLRLMFFRYIPSGLGTTFEPAAPSSYALSDGTHGC